MVTEPLHMDANHTSSAAVAPLGLIAGGGDLPVELLRHAARQGGPAVVAVGFRDFTSAEVAPAAAHFEYIGVGQLGKMLKIFKRHGVREAVMLGGLSPHLTIADVGLDLRMLLLAARTKDRRADSVLRAIADEMAKDGIHLADSTTHLQHLLAGTGALTKTAPDKKQWLDVQFGLELALAIGGLDIGQTVVVRKHAVVAVEAMEGTDACIKRAGALAKGVVVVKMAKPRQDLRFDVPCVGLDTINVMVEAEAAVLAVEAGKTFLLDKERMLAQAERQGIVVVGIAPERGGPAGIHGSDEQ